MQVLLWTDLNIPGSVLAFLFLQMTRFGPAYGPALGSIPSR